MAYYKKEKEEHAFRIIQRDIKTDSLERVLLLCGKEQFLVDWSRGELIKKYINQSSRVLDLTIIDDEDIAAGSIVSRIIESCETMPLLSSKKVVVARDLKILNSGESSDINELCSYIPNIPETTLLIFTSGNADGKRKLPKTISKYGKVYNFGPLDKKELISFADKRFRAEGISVSGAIMNMLIDETGYYNKESEYDLYRFSNDIKKMIALSEDGVLTEETVMASVEGDMDKFIFSLLNSISEDRKDKGLQLLHNIVGDRNDVTGLIALIVGQFELMYSIKQLLDNRIPDRIIVEKLGIKEARLRILKPYIVRFGIDRLRKNLELAYEIESNIKTGLLKPTLAMELFVSRL